MDDRPDGRLASVVIPVYNGEQFLADAIESVLAQHHRPLELIVVDDGSTDATPDVVDAFGGPEVIYVRQENHGHGASKNVGLGRARGRFVAFLDADDVWLPTKLSRQIGRLEADPGLGLTVSLMRNLVADGVAGQLSPAQRARMEGEQQAWLPSGLVARVETFAVVGLFDETLPHGNDTDWFARARSCGVRAAVVEEVLLHRRIHGANQSLALEAIHRDVARVVLGAVARRRRAASEDRPA